MATVNCDILDIPCHYNNSIEKLKEFVIYLWDKVLDACLYLLNLVPVPEWATVSGGIFSQVPSSVAFFMSVFEINFGLSVLGSAMLIRFIIRRLPFVG
jgi:hypothetical protein